MKVSNWIKTLNSPRTPEWQLGLSNDVMHKAWDAWVIWKRVQEEEQTPSLPKFGVTVKEAREALDVAMRNCYGQVMENDVFFSGMAAGGKNE